MNLGLIRSSLAAGALALLTLSAHAGVVYQVDRTNYAGGICPTCRGTATTFGDYIRLGGTERSLTNFTFMGQNFGNSYSTAIELKFYSVDTSGATPALGSLISTQTVNQVIAGLDNTPLGPNNNGSRTLFDISIALPNLDVPEDLIYTIEYVSNNGSTNWAVAGGASDSTVVAQVGTNVESQHFFSDWVSQFGADPNGLSVQRLGMPSFQLTDFYMTPVVTITAESDVPEPTSLALASLALAGLGFTRRKRVI